MSEKFLLQFKNSYSLVIVAIIAGIILVFLNGKAEKKDVDSKIYAKISLLIGIIVVGCVYICNQKGSITEEILTGPMPMTTV